jgi:hypothetical protein
MPNYIIPNQKPNGRVIADATRNILGHPRFGLLNIQQGEIAEDIFNISPQALSQHLAKYPLLPSSSHPAPLTTNSALPGEGDGGIIGDESKSSERKESNV